MPNIQRPKSFDKSDPRFFAVKTGAVVASVKTASDGSQTKIIKGIASSTVQDRMGDFMTEACQVSMLEQARGLTMWLNHSYKVPEDILGTLTEATLARGTDASGDCVDLIIEVEIDDGNPRAVASWSHIQKGTKLGFSIGGYFRDAEIVEDENYDYALTVNDVELLEVSLVGIPANPRAYTKAFNVVQEALKAEVVKRAEAIIKTGKTKAEAGLLVRKSLFGGVEENHMSKDLETTLTDAEHVNDEAAAHASETETVEDTKPSVEVEVTVNNEATEKAAVLETKDLTDSQAGSVVECMKSMKAASDHGMCDDAQTSVNTGHAILKAMLPAGYDVPDEANLDEGQEGEKSSTDLESKAFSDAQATITELRAQLETKSAELQKSEQQIETLKATPIGRQTLSTHPSGSDKNGGTVKDLKSMTEAELYQYQRSSQPKVDARASLG